MKRVKRANVDSSTARNFGCVNCGHPYTAYPPDDVHVVASRIASPFLEEVQSDYLCSGCKEVSQLYWSKSTAGKSTLHTLHRMYNKTNNLIGSFSILKTLLPHRFKSNELQEETDDLPDADAFSTDEADNMVYEYILSNNGAIVVNKAAEDLAMSPESIKETIQRLRLAGRLKLPDQPVAV